ncbi:uncharacterized protein [Asterias amurensis]|uniref:uncharacterized protein n=1 Tax=Asterias amurensis TaxID=7602 RepID=UPI003AB21AD5
MATVHQLSLNIHNIVLLSFMVCTTAIGSMIFTEHPRDTSVVAGSDATFRCGTDLTCSYFYWGRYKASTGAFSYISKCLTSYESQYDIQVEENVYTLLVQDVSLEDTGTVFECWQYIGKWLKSTNATLTVLPEPPSCRTSPSGPHAVGDRISLECSEPNGQNSAGLSWQSARDGIKLDNMTELSPGLPKTVELTLTEHDNFEAFICTAGEDSNGTSCSITPLAIPTNVTISPSGTLSLADGQDAEFYCEAKAVPSATSYTWLITMGGETHAVDHLQNNTDQVEHLAIDESGRTLRVINASVMGDAPLQVACKATNVLNITGISLPTTLRVEQVVDEDPRTTKSSFSPSNKETNNDRGKDTLSDWSQMTLVIGIMLCVVVVFMAAGLGLLYARWQRRMTGANQPSSPTSRTHNDNTPFSLHDPEADFRRGSLGCVRACAVMECSQLQQFGTGNDNEYMEVLGTQSNTPAPAHEKAVATEPIYERHF